MFSWDRFSFSAIPSKGCVIGVSFSSMKPELDNETTPQQKFDRFQDALRSVGQVSKNDLDQMLADEKIANAGKPKRGPKPKTSASGHAVSDKD